MARAIRTSGDSNLQTLVGRLRGDIEKPVPPKDLWKQLDALCMEHGMSRTVNKPPDTFTAAEYARECGLHPSSVSARLQALLKAGKLELMGRGRNNEKYYRIKK